MDANKILEAREEKALKVKQYIDQYQVVTLKANIPGSNKNIHTAYILINYFNHKLLEEFIPISYSFNESADGPYYMYLFSKDVVLKDYLIKLEEESLGRFVDFDCFYDSSKSLNRSKPRDCYLCGDLAFNCIRSRKHSVEELLEYVNNSTEEYICNYIYESLYASALGELDLTKKFGLVSPISSGSHKDMDYNLMKNSLSVIIPYLKEMFKVGYNSTSSLDEIFNEVKNIGLDAEKSMFEATNNVNTYIGLIFNLGLIVTNVGYCLKHNEEFNKVFDYCKYMVRNRDCNKGALKEANNGYKASIRIFENYSLDNDESKRYALIDLITTVDDSIFIKRCKDENKRNELINTFKSILETHDEHLINRINEYCEREGYSFGGCADLLIVSLFLKKANKLFK